MSVCVYMCVCVCVCVCVWCVYVSVCVRESEAKSTNLYVNIIRAFFCEGEVFQMERQCESKENDKFVNENKQRFRNTFSRSNTFLH